MDYISIIGEIAAFLFGGGLVSIITLRATSKKASEEAKAVEATNMRTILETNQKYIVEPLTKEIDELRRNVNDLTKAISCISDCSLSSTCPVRDELQKRAAAR